jgi:lipopolysaccharide biosynthesis glycosyltransferase
MVGTIDIAMGFDARYAPHAANVMASIARHAPGARLRFILLQAEVPVELRRRIEAAVGAASFVWVEVGEKDLPAHATRGHLSRAMLFRLGLEALAPQDCQRLIYIDSDTVVLGDVRELWDADLGTHPIGAVTDCYQDAAKFSETWALSPGGRYFNSGVLVIDLAQVREQKLFSRALDFVVEHDAKLVFSDQDALNHVFWKNAATLEPTWNVQRYMSLEEVRRETAPDRRWGHRAPRLVHYIGTEKPWMRDVWHPWAWLYWENLKRTPFTRDVKRAFGMNCLQLMRLRLRWWLRRPGGRVHS